MIALIVKLLSGSVFDRLVSVYEKKLQHENEAQKLAADFMEEQMKADLQVRQNAKEIRLATAGFWEMRLITFMIAAPFVAHLWLVAYDTMRTDIRLDIPAMPGPFDEWQGAILLSFFGVQVISRGFDTLAYIFGRKR